MRFSLEDLLKAEVFRGSQILYGQKFNNTISSIDIFDINKNLSGQFNETFLIMPFTYSPEIEQLLLEQVIKASKSLIGAIGIKLKESHIEFILKIKNICEDSLSPIVLVSEEINFSLINDLICNNIYCRNISKFMHWNDIHVSINKTTSEKGIKGAAIQLYNYTGQSTTIVYGQDRIEYPMSHFSEDIDYSEVWENSTPEPVLDIKKYTYGFEIRRIKHLYNQNVIEGIGIALVHNDITNYIILWRDKEEFDYNTFSLLGIAAYWCDLLSKKAYEKQMEKLSKRSNLICEILHKRIRNWDDICDEASSLDWKIPKKSFVTVIKTENADNDKIIQTLNSYKVSKFWNAYIVSKIEDDIILFIPEEKENVKHVLIEDKRLLKNKFDVDQFHIGIGREREFSDYYTSYIEARTAAESARLKDEDILYFEDLQYLRLISIMKDPVEIQHYYKDYYLPLIQKYPDDHSVLIDTLENYLNTACNYSETASMSNVHPNTIRYRIKVIEKICKVNLKTKEGILTMGLALSLSHMKGDD